MLETNLIRGPLRFRTGLFNRTGVIVGKYLIGWILGVPVIVLALIYLFMH